MPYEQQGSPRNFTGIWMVSGALSMVTWEMNYDLSTPKKFSVDFCRASRQTSRKENDLSKKLNAQKCDRLQIGSMGILTAPVLG